MKHRKVESAPQVETVKKRKTHRVRTVILRVLAFLGVTLLCLCIGVYGLCFVVFCGPSAMARDQLTLSMLGTSALKWVPEVYLPKETVDAIVAANEASVNTGVTDPSLVVIPKGDDPAVSGEWDDCPEGYRVEEVGSNNYHGWMIVVRDPSRLYVAAANDFSDPEAYGKKIGKIYEREKATVLINASGFSDVGGHGKGGVPKGLTYAKGKRVYGDADKKYSGFVGITNDNVLVVGSMSAAKAEELGVRDGVSFGPVLVVNGEMQSFSAASGGLNPRTCIGQRADGSILLLVLDGRQPGSVGASYRDVAAIMADYKAVNACNLDGGSSTVLMIDGELINHCCSLYGPRNLPTYFAIK